MAKRAGRDSRGRKTKYYRPYVPPKKKRKLSNYQRFQKCFSAWVHAEGIDYRVHGDFNQVSSEMWNGLNPQQRKNIKAVCDNVDLIYQETYLPDKVPDRSKDILGITANYDQFQYYHVRDSGRPDLLKSRYFKEGDTFEYNGYAAGSNGEMRDIFGGEWIDLGPTTEGGLNADAFHERCKEIANENKREQNGWNMAYFMLMITGDGITVDEKGHMHLRYILADDTPGELAFIADRYGKPIKEKQPEPEKKEPQPTPPAPEAPVKPSEKELQLKIEQEKTRQKELELELLKQRTELLKQAEKMKLTPEQINKLLGL